MVNGKKIREVRKNAGLTNLDLAKIIGSSTRTISEIETGKRQPTVTTLEKISKALKSAIRIFFEEKVA